jgi:hypothetical protein
LVGAVTAARQARAVGWMGAVSFGVESRFGFGGIVAALHAVEAVAEPRATAIPTESATELASVADAGLVGAGHAGETVTLPIPAKSPALEDGEYVPSGPFCGLSFSQTPPLSSG